MRVRCVNLWSGIRPMCQILLRGTPLSEAAMDLCICSSSLQSDLQI